MSTRPAPNAAPDRGELLAALRDSGDRLLAITADAELTAAVPACPDWDLAALLGHLGGLWYFQGANVRRRATDPPPPTLTRPAPPADRDQVRRWAADGFEYLFAALSGLPDGSPAWNWGRQPPVVRFWQRRMAHEALVHRRDAEQAVHASITGYGPLASDAVDELLAVFVPRALHRRPYEGPAGTVLVEASDSGAAWAVEVAGGSEVAVHPLGAGAGAGDIADAGDAGDAGDPAATRLRGTAEQLLLALWGREPLDPLLVGGDRQLAHALVVE